MKFGNSQQPAARTDVGKDGAVSTNRIHSARISDFILGWGWGTYVVSNTYEIAGIKISCVT